jgi:hypothetical protein
MKRLLATIKIPVERTQEIGSFLCELGVKEMEIETIPYEQFTLESRLNYDCVFPEMWEDRKDVTYLKFAFDGNEEGRNKAFYIEYNLMQIPLNLRYEFE